MVVQEGWADAMAGWAVRTLRVIIAVALVGSVVVQGVLAPLLWLDLDGAPPGIRISLVTVLLLGVGSLQVIGVCVWRLLTMVRRGTVFSRASFRYVDGVVAAIAALAVLLLAVAVVARFANHATPGDEVAPGLVGLICGFALVAAGVALVVHVQRVLLAQAVAMASEARLLRSELDAVI